MCGYWARLSVYLCVSMWFCISTYLLAPTTYHIHQLKIFECQDLNSFMHLTGYELIFTTNYIHVFYRWGSELVFVDLLYLSVSIWARFSILYLPLFSPIYTTPSMVVMDRVSDSRHESLSPSVNLYSSDVSPRNL